ncbi:MAG: hypothetical protein M5U26_26720 [Planctomycetota bacterium]|nr:hypothetical protein [Planctomycetota bacterium]
MSMIRRASFALLPAFLLGLALSCAQAEEASPAQESLPAESLPESARPSTFTANFLTLLADAASGAGALTADLFWSILGWSLALALLLGLVAFLLWRTLRRRGALDVRERRSGLVHGLWLALFLTLALLGGAYGGAWFGGGRCLKIYIHEHLILDQAVARLYCAVVLDKAGYRATGAESAEEFDRVLAASKGLDDLAEDDFDAGLGKLSGVEEHGLIANWCLRGFTWLVGDALGEWLLGADPRTVFLFFIRTPSVDAYLEANPGANPWVLAIAKHMKTLRKHASKTVDAWVYPNLALGLLAGLGLPLAVLGLFRLVLRLFPKPQPAAAPAAPKEPDPPQP